MGIPLNRRILTRAAIIVVPVLAAAAGAVAIFAPDKPVASVVDATNTPTIQVRDNGLARYLSTPADQPIAPPADLPAGADPETAARAHLKNLGAAFGIKDEAKELRTVAALPQGKTSVVRFQQTYGGLPVIGGQLAVTVNAAGGLLAINGETGDTAEATTKATISAATARQHAIASVARDLKVPAAKLRASKPTLSLYDASLVGPDAIPGARPVWRLEVTAPSRADIDRYVLVDAVGGQVALSFSQVEALSDPNRKVCDFKGATVADPTCDAAHLARQEGTAASGTADVDAAYELTGAMHRFLQTVGRDGVDGKGLSLVSSVRVCLSGYACPLPNAFWDGTQMVFGTGYATADDVVGHELTHGVTQYTSNLLYYYQSGAINESVSDVLGELFDLSFDGETVATPATSAPAASAPATSDQATGTPQSSAPATSDPATGTPEPSAPATSEAATSAAPQTSAAEATPETSAAEANTASSAPETATPPTSAPGTTTAETTATTTTGGAAPGVRPGAAAATSTAAGKQGLVAGRDEAAVRWLIGEDLPRDARSPFPAGDGGAIRSMSNPPAGYQPDSLTSTWWNPDWFDVGGVHTNSGVGNKAAYLMTDGGNFGGVDVAGIHDLAKVARIWLGADQLLTSGADYADLAYALQQSCANLGYAAECDSVSAAVAAVQMTAKPAKEAAIAQAGICPAGQRPSNLLLDRFSNTDKWTLSSTAYLDNHVKPSTVAGNSLLLETPYVDNGANITATLKTALSFPTSGTVYVRFDHLDALDWGLDDETGLSYFFDLGYLGITTSTASSPSYGTPKGTWVNGPTKKQPFGTTAFGGDSRGWTSSRIALDSTTYKGQKVKLQFKITPDGVPADSAGYGWWLDNVQVYTCSAKSPVHSDYNGDGVNDVAIGSPDRDLGGLADAGAVTVSYGSTSSGLTTSGARVLTTGSGAAGALPVVDQQFGSSVASADFNGDGFADLAVGAAAKGGTSGSVTVFYGSAEGITSRNAKVFGSATFATAASGFGKTLAAGDVNKDGYADLAIGVEGADAAKGGIGLLRGGSGGLSTSNKQWLTQDSSGVPGAGEAGDRFGNTLAFGDFNKDGYADLAIGVYHEAVGSEKSAGAIVVLPGSSSGLTGSNSKGISQDTSGVPGAAEAGDLFGAALAVGDVNKDGYADLAVGSPGEALSGTGAGGGSVTVLKGSSGGITTSGSASFSQSTSGVPGAAETGDLFGSALSAGDLTGDGYADLAVGVPGEAIGAMAAAGTVDVLKGSSSGLQGTGALALDQTAVTGGSTANDQFGAAVLVTKIKSGTGANLLVGSPGESDAAGAVELFPTGPTATGATMVNNGLFDGKAQAGTHFGAALG